MDFGCLRQCVQVARIGGEDVVAVGGEAYDAGIDGIDGIGLAASASRSPAPVVRSRRTRFLTVMVPVTGMKHIPTGALSSGP